MILPISTLFAIMCLSSITPDVLCETGNSFRGNKLRRTKRETLSWQRTLDIINGQNVVFGGPSVVLQPTAGTIVSTRGFFRPSSSLQVAQEQPQQLPVQTYRNSPGANRFNADYNLQPTQYGGYGQQSGGYQLGGNPNNYVPDNGQSLRCFTPYYDTLAINLQPFERRYGITANDCAYHCISSARLLKVNCRSFGFNHYSSVCDLFTGTGAQPPAMLVNIPGNGHYILNAECDQQPVEPSASTSIGATTTALIFTTTTVPPPRSCPDGKTALMQKISQKQLSIPNGPQFPGVDEMSCYQGCQNNVAPDGFPFKCIAVNYIRATGNCQFLLTEAAPAGGGTLESNSNADYFEKICITDPLGQTCRGPIDRYSQFVLVGFNQMVVNTTYVGCVEICLDSQNRFNFVCKSANYYYKLPSDNCVLNFDDSTQNKPLLIEQTEDRTEYFEITKCLSPSRTRNVING